MYQDANGTFVYRYLLIDVPGTSLQVHVPVILLTYNEQTLTAELLFDCLSSARTGYMKTKQ
jgi:hypothetical protein